MKAYPEIHIFIPWMRVVLSVILLFASLSARENTHKKVHRYNMILFSFVGMILCLKEVFFFFNGNNWVNAMTDALLFFAAHISLISREEKNIPDYHYARLLFFVIIILCIHFSEKWIPGSIISEIQIFSLLIGLSPILFVSDLYSVKRNMGKKKLYFITFTISVQLIYAVMLFSYQYSSYITTVLLQPLPYLIIYSVLFAHLFSEIRTLKENNLHLDVEKKSTYDFFKNIGTVMLENKDPEAINMYILSTVMEQTHAESGGILLYDSQEDQLFLSAKKGSFVIPCEVPENVKGDEELFHNYFSIPAEVPKQTLIDNVFRSGKTFLVGDVLGHRFDKQFKEIIHNNFMFVSSIMIIPVNVNGNPIGVVCVQHNTPGNYFTKDINDIISSLSVFIEIMLTNIRIYKEILEKQDIDRDIALSYSLQKSLLPSRIPSSDNYHFTAYTKAARHISGDYHDFIHFKSGKIAFLICDVAGKGIAAGLVMTAIRTAVHMVSEERWNTSSVMRLLNRCVLDTGGEHFATASLFLLDPETGELEFSNAAHLPSLYFSQKNGYFTQLDTDGLPLGIQKDSVYNCTTVTLDPGDLLFLFTDGINETMNKKREQFGKQRLQTIIKENCTQSLQMISQSISSSLEKFQDGATQHDDQTFLLMKRI